MLYKLYTLDNQFIKQTNNCPANFTGIVEYPNGSKNWYFNAQLHRLDGPAVEHPNGSKNWYFNAQLHRLDGPAVEYPNGENRWYIDGKLVTEQEHNLLHSIMKLKGLI